MIFFVLYEATPRRTHPQTDEIAGAFVECWIDAPSQAEAERIASLGIQSEGRIVESPDGIHIVDQSLIPIGSPKRKYYEQALTDKQVYVFNNWPIDEGLGSTNKE